jgi:nucleoside 2-deoxyribosyltransferase
VAATPCHGAWKIDFVLGVSNGLSNPDFETRSGSWDALQAIYLLIAGLAIAEAITRTFTRSDGAFVGADLFDSSSGLLLVAFLVTVVRFAHGSVLHLTALNDQRKWRVNMCGLFLQAVIFFIAGLTVRQTTGFLVAILAILITDSLWLILLRRLEREKELPAFTQWICSNVLLGLFLGACLASRVWWLGASWEKRIAIATAIAAVIAAVADYWQNGYLYAPGRRALAPPALPADIRSSSLSVVYVAAPLFTLAERHQNAELARALTYRFGDQVKFLLPQELDIGVPPDYEYIASTNMDALASADVVLACLDGVDADSGTSFEVGYAHGIGKPVLAYRTDIREEEADGVNAMLRYGCTQYVRLSALDTTLASLADELAAQLSQPAMLDRQWNANAAPA